MNERTSEYETQTLRFGAKDGQGGSRSRGARFHAPHGGGDVRRRQQGSTRPVNDPRPSTEVSPNFSTDVLKGLRIFETNERSGFTLFIDTLSLWSTLSQRRRV